MTIETIICDTIKQHLEERFAYLKSINAPSIYFEKEQPKFDIVQAYDIKALKVKGMARKHKGCNTLEVEEVRVLDTAGNYYGKGRKTTKAIIMKTKEGIYVYDMYDNKIEKCLEHTLSLNCEIPWNKLKF